MLAFSVALALKIGKRCRFVSSSFNAQVVPQPSSPSWIGIVIALYAFIAIGIAEGGLGVLLPSILSTYQLTTATVTLLFVSQISGYITAAFTSSLISSRIGLARMLLVAALSLTFALLTYSLSAFWWLMVAAGTLLGLGIGLIDAGINTYVVNDQRHAHLIGLLHAFYGIGALLGPAVATTLLAIGLEWQRVYLVFAGVVGVLIMGLIRVIVGRYQPMMVQPLSETSASLNLRLALKTPVVLIMGLLLFVYVGTEVSIGNWAYTVQHVGRGTDELIAGYSVSAYWLGLTLGRFSLSYLMRRLGAFHTIDFSLALLIFGVLLWWQFPSLWLSLPLIGFALAAIFPSTMWLVPRRVSTALVPAAIGFMTSVASLGAASLPTLTGWIADRASLESIPPLMLPMAILMLLLHRWLGRLSRPTEES